MLKGLVIASAALLSLNMLFREALFYFLWVPTSYASPQKVHRLSTAFKQIFPRF